MRFFFVSHFIFILSPVDDDDDDDDHGNSITFRINAPFLADAPMFECSYCKIRMWRLLSRQTSLLLAVSIIVHRSVFKPRFFVFHFFLPHFRSFLVPFDGINSQISKIIQDIIHGSEFDVDSCWLHKTFWFQTFYHFCHSALYECKRDKQKIM